MTLQQDIVQTDHMIDDSTEVITYREIKRREKEAFQVMQDAAIDAYIKVFEETGDRAKAEEEFFLIHEKFYADNLRQKRH